MLDNVKGSSGAEQISA